MGIESIPVVTAQGPETGLTGNAAAILREVATLLDNLVQTGENGCIDLGNLPLTSADTTWLKEKLGQGEVEISMNLNGASHVRETAYPGVWWVTHENEQGNQTGEFIEVTRIPAMVPAQDDDIERGSQSLNFLIHDLC